MTERYVLVDTFGVRGAITPTYGGRAACARADGTLVVLGAEHWYRLSPIGEVTDVAPPMCADADHIAEASDGRVVVVQASTGATMVWASDGSAMLADFTLPGWGAITAIAIADTTLYVLGTIADVPTVRAYTLGGTLAGSLDLPAGVYADFALTDDGFVVGTTLPTDRPSVIARPTHTDVVLPTNARMTILSDGRLVTARVVDATDTEFCVYDGETLEATWTRAGIASVRDLAADGTTILHLTSDTVFRYNPTGTLLSTTGLGTRYYHAVRAYDGGVLVSCAREQSDTVVAEDRALDGTLRHTLDDPGNYTGGRLWRFAVDGTALYGIHNNTVTLAIGNLTTWQTTGSFSTAAGTTWYLNDVCVEAGALALLGYQVIFLEGQNRSYSQVRRFTTTGTLLDTTPVPIGTVAPTLPTAIATWMDIVGGARWFAVTTSTVGALRRYAFSGEWQQTIASYVVNQPVAIAANGTALVARALDGALTRYAADGTISASCTAAAITGWQSVPEDRALTNTLTRQAAPLTCDEDGMVRTIAHRREWSRPGSTVTQTGGRLHVIDIDTATVTAVGPDLAHPVGRSRDDLGYLARAADGTLYVCDPSLRRVQVLTAQGLPVGSLGDTGVDGDAYLTDGPLDVAIDGDDVLVLDADDVVRRYLAATGAFVDTIALPDPSPFLAQTSVVDGTNGTIAHADGRLREPGTDPDRDDWIVPESLLVGDDAVSEMNALIFYDPANWRRTSFDPQDGTAYHSLQTTPWERSFTRQDATTFTLDSPYDMADGFVSDRARDVVGSYTGSTINGTFGTPGTGDGEFDDPGALTYHNYSACTLLAVADDGNARVQIWNVSDTTGEVQLFAWPGTSYLPPLVNPLGCALDTSTNRVYVCDTDNDQILIFSDTTGELVETLGTAETGIYAPSWIAVGVDGLFIANGAGLYAVTLSGVISWMVEADYDPADGHIDAAGPVRAAADGRVYLMDYERGCVHVFEGDDGTFVRRIGSAGTDDGEFDPPLDHLHGIATTSADLFFSDAARVQRFDLATGAWQATWTPTEPMRLLGSRGDHLYVRDEAGVCSELTTAFAVARPFGISGFILDMDGEGDRVLVLDGVTLRLYSTDAAASVYARAWNRSGLPAPEGGGDPFVAPIMVAGEAVIDASGIHCYTAMGGYVSSSDDVPVDVTGAFATPHSSINHCLWVVAGGAHPVRVYRWTEPTIGSSRLATSSWTDPIFGLWNAVHDTVTGTTRFVQNRTGRGVFHLSVTVGDGRTPTLTIDPSGDYRIAAALADGTVVWYRSKTVGRTWEEE
jgi:hypothetical protein